jgi:hypothetical protein
MILRINSTSRRYKAKAAIEKIVYSQNQDIDNPMAYQKLAAWD